MNCSEVDLKPFHFGVLEPWFQCSTFELSVHLFIFFSGLSLCARSDAPLHGASGGSGGGSERQPHPACGRERVHRRLASGVRRREGHQEGCAHDPGEQRLDHDEVLLF